MADGVAQVVKQPVAAAPAPLQNNSWFHRSQSRTVIIFVHGIFSSSDACWRNPKADALWPDLVKSDPRFEDASIFLGGYETGLSSGRFDTRDAATRLHAALRTPDELPSPLSKDRILFVCHSQGGIVVRRMLCSEQPSFVGKKVGLILCCSPSWGSRYAWFLRPLTWLIGNAQARQLSTDHESLKDLDKDWQTMAVRKPFDLTGTCLVETKLRVLRFIPVPVIVGESSAAHYFPWTRIAGADHSEVVKPDSVSCASHHALRDFAHSKGFLTRQPFGDALKMLVGKMGVLERQYAQSSTEEARARAIKGVRDAAFEALVLQDRTDHGLEGLVVLRAAALSGDGDWAFHDFSRAEFGSLAKRLRELLRDFDAI
jgi:hypothetical protein